MTSNDRGWFYFVCGAAAFSHSPGSLSARPPATSDKLEFISPHLFDWGTGLPIHRALEPATEVFTKGDRLFPKSVRTLAALGVARHARDCSGEGSAALELS